MVPIPNLPNLVMIVLHSPLVRHVLPHVLLLFVLEVARERPDLLPLNRVVYQPVIEFKTQFMPEFHVACAVD